MAVLLLCLSGCTAPAAQQDVDPATAGPAGPAGLRFTGTVEAVRSWTVAVPRLAGQSLNPLVITSLVPPGTRVDAGDLLVVFDRQEQERIALDRQAELVDLDGQIARKQSEQAAEEAKDQTELTRAQNDVARARLDVRKNPLVARVEAEKNSLALEQATARLDQLEKTYDLKRTAAAADLRILEIRRERAERALQHARDNAERMEIRAPFAGLIVAKRTYRNGAFVEILEGDDVRPGTPVIDIVDTSIMQVRAKISQADVALVRQGQQVKVGLDGFPSLVFDGRIDLVSPIGVLSERTQAVRTFMAVIAVDGQDPQLLPDLTAWIEASVTSETRGSDR